MLYVEFIFRSQKTDRQIYAWFRSIEEIHTFIDTLENCFNVQGICYTIIENI